MKKIKIIVFFAVLFSASCNVNSEKNDDGSVIDTVNVKDPINSNDCADTLFSSVGSNICYAYNVKNNNQISQRVSWIDCCTGKLNVESIDPGISMYVCSRTEPSTDAAVSTDSVQCKK